jgi:hypothetical protein
MMHLTRNIYQKAAFMDRHPIKSSACSTCQANTRLDAEANFGGAVLAERIERASAFRLYAGRLLDPDALARLGLADVISEN